MTDTIEIKGLCKTFHVEGRAVEVLKNLDLLIPAHEITVLLGRSGCGKTTLLRLIGGLEQPDSGTIRRPPDSKTAFVFQEARLMPWLSVQKNIAFGLKKKDVRRSELEHLIAMTGLQGFEDALPGQLSGGMQQRCALARALASKPDFILMDEPSATLTKVNETVLKCSIIIGIITIFALIVSNIISCNFTFNLLNLLSFLFFTKY